MWIAKTHLTWSYSNSGRGCFRWAELPSPLLTTPPGPDHRTGVSPGLELAPLRPNPPGQALGLPWPLAPFTLRMRWEDGDHLRLRCFLSPDCSDLEEAPSCWLLGKDRHIPKVSLCIPPPIQKYVSFFSLHWKSYPEVQKHLSVCPSPALTLINTIYWPRFRNFHSWLDFSYLKKMLTPSPIS